MNLQLLSEEESTPVTEDFEELIRGKYKEQFDARVQRILDKRLRGLRQENQTLTRQRESQRERELAAFARLADQQERLQAIYPGFDWKCEVRNPEFGRLIRAGVEPAAAYELVHREKLMQQAMAYAAARSREETARAVASGGRHVRENGGRSASVSRPDPKGLSSQELAEIRKRVFDGEKIRF